MIGIGHLEGLSASLTMFQLLIWMEILSMFALQYCIKLLI